MNAEDAKNLLSKIAEKKANVFGTPHADIAQEIYRNVNADAKSSANRLALTAIITSLGLGAGVRGLQGLNSITPPAKKRTGRVVDMPVAYPEKRADNEKATSPLGVNYFIPSAVLGSALAAYGGWKGVDSLINRSKQQERDSALDEAKQEYEQALLGSYKQAVENSLDLVFSNYPKVATDGLFGRMRDAFNTMFPNVEGAATGLATTYGLATLPLGYMLVDSAMKSKSKRALLQKAIQERSRRQALEQPAELYAIPTPVSVSDK
jgi:hypothetical protein